MQYICFGDASEKAYSAVIYMRAIDRDVYIKVDLITAKTKMTSVKFISTLFDQLKVLRTTLA